MKWQIWLDEFLNEWHKQAGYYLEPDETSEEYWRIDYFDEGISPCDAVIREMSEG